MTQTNELPGAKGKVSLYIVGAVAGAIVMSLAVAAGLLFSGLLAGNA